METHTKLAGFVVPSVTGLPKAWCMSIVADTKDWTWVIDRPCPECGFDATEYGNTRIPSAIRDNAASWAPVIARPTVRDRPNDFTWSALEYSAHVRDVLKVYRERLRLMLETDNPLYPNWDQDETAIAERYNEQDPTTIAGDIAANADDLANAFAALDASQWQRAGRRSDGASFTVSSMAKYMTHDLVHHRWDVSGR
jgi:hypothetical protein